MRLKKSSIRSSLNKKRAFFMALYAIYISFILISTIPYIAEDEINRGKITNGNYESHLIFPSSGTYGHYTEVLLINNETLGKIDLVYTYESHTLRIQNVENIKELTIDCKMMYENKYQEVYGINPSTMESNEYYKTLFRETNNGIFTVLIDADKTMDKLQFINIPIPKSVKVNQKEWWQTETQYYSLSDNDITITEVQAKPTTVVLDFKSPIGIPPVARFTVNKELALVNEKLHFNASSSTDEDGDIISYIWDFGDKSNPDSGETTDHIFTRIGVFKVMLTIEDDGLNRVSTSKNITIVTDTTDSDSDNVPDIMDPNPDSNIDTDGDDLPDDYEDIVSKTNKNELDSDDDGYNDKEELDNDYDPNNAESHPPEKAKKTEDDDDSFMIIMLIALIAIIVIIGIVLFMAKKRKKDEEDEDEEDLESVEVAEVEAADYDEDEEEEEEYDEEYEGEVGEEEEDELGEEPGDDLDIPPEEMAPPGLGPGVMGADVGAGADLPIRKEGTKVRIIKVKGPPKRLMPVDEPSAEEAASEPELPPPEPELPPPIVEEGEVEGEEEEEFECPDCGSTIPGDVAACPICGAEFEDDDEEGYDFECPECGAGVEETTTICPECGTDLE